MTHSNLPCATYLESCGFGLRQKQAKIVMELPVACQRGKTPTPFPAWRPRCNHQWMQAPPSPWLTFKERNPDMTQTAVPSSAPEKKPTYIVSSDFFFPFIFLTLMQVEKVPDVLLTSLIKGLRARCKWLCYARAHHFPSSLQELQLYFLMQTSVRGNRQTKSSRKWRLEFQWV